jgi:hypothetical protein
MVFDAHVGILFMVFGNNILEYVDGNMVFDDGILIFYLELGKR